MRPLDPAEVVLLLSPRPTQESHGEAAPGREDIRQIHSARQTGPKYKEKRQKGRCGELTPARRCPKATDGTPVGSSPFTAAKTGLL